MNKITLKLKRDVFIMLLIISFLLVAISSSASTFLLSTVSAQEKCQSDVISSSLDLTNINTSYNPSDSRAPAGVSTITATWVNASTVDSFFDVFAKVTELSGGNVLLNADNGPGGVGSKVTLNLGSNNTWSPGGEIIQVFEIGHSSRSQFNFNVDLMGVKGLPGSCISGI